MPKFKLVTRLIALLAIAICWTGLSPNSANAQTTADHLYRSVMKLQASLGNGEDADEIRDMYMIRDLEFESGFGFSGNPSVLQQAANQFSAAEDLSPELQTVKDALDAHLDSVYSAGSVNVQNDVPGFGEKMNEVDIAIIDEARKSAVEAVQRVKAYNNKNLSIYGAHYLNERLGIDSLSKQLSEFEIPESFEDDDASNAFNRSLVRFRQTAGNAQREFGLASTEYHNPVVANAEHKLKVLQERSFAYLISQSARARGALEARTAQRKTVFVDADGVLADPSDRLYQAELGRWVSLLQQRGLGEGLNASARLQFSRPNMKITVQESLVNRLAGQTISEVEHLDEVIVGTRALGFTTTTGFVTLDFVDSPSSAYIRIGTNGSIQSDAYSKEGPVTAFTKSNGNFSASRDILANIGSVSVFDTTGDANIWSEFLGTDCRLGLVNRIAVNRFNERQQRAQEVSSERAKERLLGRFTEQTDEALDNGLGQLEQLRSREGELKKTLNETRGEISIALAEKEDGTLESPFRLIDQFVLPRLFISTSDSELNIGGLLEGDNRFAAGSNPPVTTIPADLRFQLHESMVSNLIAPLIQDRLIESWQFRTLIQSISPDGGASLPDEDEEKRFGIQFEDGRPIQFEFEGNELGIRIFGKQFQQGRDRYTDPINIHIRLLVVNDAGTLKLVREGMPTVTFTFDPPEGKTRSAKDITFRQFLSDSLETALKGDPMDTAIELPADMLLLTLLENEELNEQLEKMKLVEFTSENGWLTLGWNYVEGGLGSWTSNTPAIWPAAAAPPESENAEKERAQDTDLPTIEG